MNAAPKLPHRATYADLEAAPSNRIAELVAGVLHVMPRPAPRHASAEGGVTEMLRGPFHRGRGGPGGWWILPEPELHFPDPTALGEVDALVPDLAGWRRERMPDLPKEAFFSLAPDWICEILSPSTESFDRDKKMAVYAREGVRWAWLINPIERTIEVYDRNVLTAVTLTATLSNRCGGCGGAITNGDRIFWTKGRADVGVACCPGLRIAPFDAIELDLSAFWEDT
jgi:hypothetical protein